MEKIIVKEKGTTKGKVKGEAAQQQEKALQTKGFKSNSKN